MWKDFCGVLEDATKHLCCTGIVCWSLNNVASLNHLSRAPPPTTTVLTYRGPTKTGIANRSFCGIGTAAVIVLSKCLEKKNILECNLVHFSVGTDVVVTATRHSPVCGRWAQRLMAHTYTPHIHTKNNVKKWESVLGSEKIPVEWFWNLVQMQSMRMTRWVCINALLDWTEQINHCLLFCRTTEFEEPIMQEVAQREHKHVMDFSVMVASIQHFKLVIH